MSTWQSERMSDASQHHYHHSFLEQPSDHDKSNYRNSPLTPILKELRRKHVVAAAATTGPQLNDSSSDPWSVDFSEQDDDDVMDIFLNSGTCTCNSQLKIMRRRSSLFDQREMVSTSNRTSNADLCHVCGKRKIFDPIAEVIAGRGQGSNIRRPRSNTLEHGALRVTHSLAVPKHAEALLHSTPHLRHLSTASTDLQGSGNLNGFSSRGLMFGILALPSVVAAGVSGNQSSSTPAGGGGDSSGISGANGTFLDYPTSLARDKANQLAATELSSFLFVLAHEMSLDSYGYVESEVFTSIFSLVHSNDAASRMAGVAALDALIEAPSADEEKKAIKFANNLSSSLRSPNGDYEFLSAVSKALGHMAVRATNVDFVESEITRALEWLRSDRSQRRLAACLTLKELAINAPTAFYAKTSSAGHGVGSNEFLDNIASVLSDPQPIARVCAADALSQCLKILVERQHASLTAQLCQIHFALMDGLKQDPNKKKSPAAMAEAEQANHGSLLAIASMIHYTRDFMLPRFDEICDAVLAFTDHPKALIRLEVVRLIPRLGRRCPSVFGRRYLDIGLLFLLKSAATPAPVRVGVAIRPPAYSALGQLIAAMNDPDNGRLIGASPSPTVKILNSNSTDPNSASVIIETSKTGVIYEKLTEIFWLVRKGLRPNLGGPPTKANACTRTPALFCAADLVEALGSMAEPFLPDLINDMFGSGLTEDLIDCLHAISASMPSQQAEIEDRLLQEMSMCLAGTAAADRICDPLSFFGNGFCEEELVPWNIARREDLIPRREGRPVTLFVYGTEKNLDRRNSVSGAEVATESSPVKINMSDEPDVIPNLVLCLRTLSGLGENNGLVKIKGDLVPILPFVRDIVSHYLHHPSKEVRMAAAVTCCSLLIPFEIPEPANFGATLHQDAIYASRKRLLGTHSGRVIEEVLTKLLQVALADPSPVLRLCVVRALDERYDYFLCQAHHIQPLFFLLQDEALVTRAAGLRLLGRLTRLNPAPILPVMRKVLVDLIVELRCGGDTGRSREEATRLLVEFLRAEPLQRLIQPVLASVVEALPLKGVSPRLASASLEALGELARASRSDLKPWVKDIIPQIMETMQDQSSASKQRISLRTLGQIAGSTGYVVRPYLDYPELLSQATDVLPGTKRAPWALRREVIRTLGIVGALDPDQYHTFAPKTRKGGAVGGGYFAEREIETAHEAQGQNENAIAISAKADEDSGSNGKTAPALPNVASDFGDHVKDVDEDMPAHLYMYEQYAMVALPVSKIAPTQRIMPSDEDFYPTVAIQALTRIFKDPSLAVHHGTVMQAIMFIFNFLDQKCVPFLRKVVPHMLHTIRTCSASNLRESLLKQVASLSGIVREHLRPYVLEIFEIVDELWDSRHLGTILALVTKIAAGVPDDFRRNVPRLVRKLLVSLDDVQKSDWFTPQQRRFENARAAPIEFEKLELILRSIKNLRGVLGDYLHLLVPGLLKLADALAPASSARGTGDVNQAKFNSASIHTFQTLSHVLEYDCARPSSRAPAMSWGDVHTDSLPIGCSLPARATQPLARLLRQNNFPSKAVGFAIIESLCVCARQLGKRRWIPLYHDVVRLTIKGWQKQVGLEDAADSVNEMNVNGGQLAGLFLYDEVIQNMKSPNLVDPDSSFRTIGDNRRDSFYDTRQVRSELFGESLSVGATIESGLDQSQHDPQNNPMIQPVLNQTSRHKVNQTALSLAWDVSQKASRDDWTEWMRRFAIQLLREAPSPALRATASLAHAYQPLARELFSAAFVCCWEELTDQYRRDLVHALETAFVADVSPEILQTLLNLAEFMEHDGVGTGLPIDISNLAELALKCRSYAKALHYKEREYSQGGSGNGGCVESLISINKKLDLPEAALGVLKTSQLQMNAESGGALQTQGYGAFSDHLTSHFLRNGYTEELRYSVVASTDLTYDNPDGGAGISEVRESWLSKLGSWSEALQIYEDKLSRNPQDFDAILGCMRCLDASGEWQRVLDIAEQSWPTLSGSALRKILKEANADSMNTHLTPKGKRKFLKFGAQAAWRLADWDGLEKYASALVHGNFDNPLGTSQSSRSKSTSGGVPVVDFDGAFFSAVIHIHRKQWSQAATAIDAARQAMDARFTALMAESYKRAYSGMISAQILAEMEEIIAYRKLESRAIASSHRHPTNRPNMEEARPKLLSVWRDRLAGCRVDADVHSKILAVRSLVLGPTDEVQATLMLSDLSKQARMFKLAEKTLLDPLVKLGANLSGPVFGFGLPEDLGLGLSIIENIGSANGHIIDRLVTGQATEFRPMYGAMHEQCCEQIVQEAGGLERLQIQHKLYFAFVKHLWSMDQRDESIHRLERLCNVVDLVSHCEKQRDRSLGVACWLELGDFQIEDRVTPNAPLPPALQVSVLFALKRAVTSSSSGYRAWHAWALLNFRLAEQLNKQEEGSTARQRNQSSSNSLGHHVVAAAQGFSNAISLGTKRWSASVQQDMLNLLTCLFKYGDLPDVANTINSGMRIITLEAWLGVLPQLLARIHIRKPSVRSVLHPLLTRLGEKHPQALMYPLSVLLKSPVLERKSAAESLMKALQAHSSSLVEEALIVSTELIRVAILWLETWHEGLEDASRLYFGEGNVSGMLELLMPLHERLENGAETQKEQEFVNSFGADLDQAHAFVKEYVRIVTSGGGGIPTQGGSDPAAAQYDQSGNLVRQSEEAETAMNKAWDIYYTVFRWINKQLPALTKLELNQCSPALSKAHSLELGVPGSYRVDGSYVRIEQFIPNVQVITSKQRPRKIILRGSDGKDYVFLLKGHEDLRQDERVMQLFGLVNALLARDRQTKKHDLNIQRYAISPLSHNCGVVGWVPHCETLHSMIRDYRANKKIPLNMENREMLKIAPDYDMLSVMQKVEVFTDALKRVAGRGNDLYEILWLKSTNSEEWLERRTRYTRSLAVMSMVGYILGLGDRHPSNLMLDQLSGRVLHIDFGDCFEVAMNREKYPEKIPFRLTRMLVKAMEVSGIEGSYRSTCERTMSVLRYSRDSLVAMLEAFVYDPLISWRLVGLSEKEEAEGDLEASHAVVRHEPAVEAHRNKLLALANPTTILDAVEDNDDEDCTVVVDEDKEEGEEDGAPIQVTRSLFHESIAEGLEEDGDENQSHQGGAPALRKPSILRIASSLSERIGKAEDAVPGMGGDSAMNAAKSRSFQMYSNIQTMAANLSTSSRIASITGDGTETRVAVEGSIAKSRIARSLRQREVMSLLEGQEGTANEEALNEKALKVIRRVQDKLSGTDLDENGESLDVPDQVQRLIVQATSSENLSQLFIGWCAFW